MKSSARLRRLRRGIVWLGCIVPVGIAWAAGQASTNYRIARDNISAGAAVANSASFQIARTTLGNVVTAGTVNNNCYILKTGYGAGVGPTPFPLNLLSVNSEKTHAATVYAQPVNYNQTLCGRVTVEPRLIGTGHKLIFHFDNPISSLGSVTVLDKFMNPAATANAVFAGNDVIVTLTDVNDSTRLTVLLNSLNGSIPSSTSIGFLVGDVNSSGSVTASDIAAVKAHIPGGVNGTNFIYDLDASGGFESLDKTLAKSRSGRVIP